MTPKPVFKLRLILTPDRTGGFIVTSPDIPELLTEGETAADAIGNVRDALEAVRELYDDMNRPFPTTLRPQPTDSPVAFETVIEAA